MNKYTQKYYITNDAMDINYRLKPISVIMYFEDCVARYMTLKNLAAFDIVGEHLYWVVSDFNLKFEKELPFWSEPIEITVWVSEISKLKVYVDFELKHNGEIFVKGDSCWFILNSETKRPVSTDFIVNRFEVCEKRVFGEHTKFKLHEQKELVTTIKHATNISDLDFNYHVNNKSYLIMAETTAPEEFKNTHTLNMLKVKFCKESFLGDVLECSAYRTDVNNLYVHKIERDGTSICEIETYWTEKIKETPILDCNLDVRKY